MYEIKLRPIGIVSSPITESMDEDWGEIRSKIILEPEFDGALLGLEGFPMLLS
jgi:tRNA (Thr-GGU) A37 N-methylase